jgi:hypothetical protein
MRHFHHQFQELLQKIVLMGCPRTPGSDCTVPVDTISEGNSRP